MVKLGTYFSLNKSISFLFFNLQGEFNIRKNKITTRFLSNIFEYNKYTMSGAYQDTKSLYIKNYNKLIIFRNLEYTRPKTISNST